MRLSSLACLSLSALALAACTPADAGHPVCKDEQSTTDYGVKWMDDLAGAREAGKVDVGQVMDIQGRSFEKLGLLKDKKYADYCRHLDQVREEAGF